MNNVAIIGAGTMGHSLAQVFAHEKIIRKGDIYV